mmetsp:Transcript_29169/g.42973  ORF Transcript_29169/g.42973 Transcript_29169/m.42973 type:complete len:209 (-) Transcript_29169:615-1241(-)
MSLRHLKFVLLQTKLTMPPPFKISICKRFSSFLLQLADVCFGVVLARPFGNVGISLLFLCQLAQLCHDLRMPFVLFSSPLKTLPLLFVQSRSMCCSIFFSGELQLDTLGVLLHGPLPCNLLVASNLLGMSVSGCKALSFPFQLSLFACINVALPSKFKTNTLVSVIEFFHLHPVRQLAPLSFFCIPKRETLSLLFIARLPMLVCVALP